MHLCLFFLSAFLFFHGNSCPDLCQCSFGSARCFFQNSEEWFIMEEEISVYSLSGPVGSTMRTIIQSMNVFVILETDSCQDLIRCE